MIGGNGAGRFDEPVPAALRESLVLGLTRMRLLHNLARLAAGQPPDHAGGGVGDWVRADRVAWVTTDGPDRALRFDIIVRDRRTADAVLRLDEAGWPAERAQTVRFPGGEMQVTERYEVR